MITFFFPKKKRFVFVCHHYYYKKVVNYPNFLFVCVFFSSENVFLRILLVWSDRFQCLDVCWLSLDVRRLRKERLARVWICLHNKRGFDHVDSERTFYTYIQSSNLFFHHEIDSTRYPTLRVQTSPPSCHRISLYHVQNHDSRLLSPSPFNNTHIHIYTLIPSTVEVHRRFRYTAS